MAGPVRIPAADAVLTTCPSPCSIIRGTNERMPWATPSRLTSTIQRQRSAGTVHASPPMPTPALLHSTCAVPNRSNVAAASASTADGSRTSVTTAATSSAPNWSARASVALSSAARSTSATTTRIPSRAKRWASAKPMPDAPPVTTATLPSRSSIRGTLVPVTALDAEQLEGHAEPAAEALVGGLRTMAEELLRVGVAQARQVGGVAAQRVDTGVERGGDVHGVQRPGRPRDRQVTPARPRFQALVAQLREHPAVRGVAHRVDGRLPHDAVVGHVEVGAAVGLAVVDGDHQLGALAPDGGGQVAPQRQAVLDRAVGVVEELDVGHSHHRGAVSLLAHPYPGALGGVHRVDAGLALADEQVGDPLALSGPAGYGGGTAVLHVVGVGHDRQRPLPVLRELVERRLGLGGHPFADSTRRRAMTLRHRVSSAPSKIDRTRASTK